MYLSIQEMKNNEIITTGIRVEESMTIRGLRLRLFKYGAPDGDLTLTLKDGATTIGSINITMAALDADVGTYFHGYVLFEGDNAGFRINVDPTTAYKELDIELTLDISMFENGEYTITATIFDNIGNSGSIESGDFGIRHITTTIPTTTPPPTTPSLPPLNAIDLVQFLLLDIIALGGGIGIALLFEKVKARRKE